MTNLHWIVAVVLSLWFATRTSGGEIHAGFGEVEITPSLQGKPVYIAGFGHNRKATAVHDPLMARAVVFQHEDTKLAIVSVDVVGLFHPFVVRVRERLPGFNYVLVSSTHNHEGPDTLGLWGPLPLVSGIDRAYMKQLEDKIVDAVRAAEVKLAPVHARIGAAKAPDDLLHDSREPYVKHDDLVALKLSNAGKSVGIIVQWNCHPETLGSKNTELSADYIGYTVQHLRERYHCPVIYLTGTVGGLMTSLHVTLKDKDGKDLKPESWEITEVFGRKVGHLAEQALEQAKPIQLTPLQIRSRQLYVPMTNKNFLLGRQLGVFDRPAHHWTGDSSKADLVEEKTTKKPLCLRTEIAWLRLGELEVAAIPGEIYPELVLDRVQNPADAGADFPDAPIEPAIYGQMAGPHRMLIGLANDEIGYILPKRQWDEKPPYCYGRTRSQYGEENSIGPDAAPILCRAFQDLVRTK